MLDDHSAKLDKEVRRYRDQVDEITQMAIEN